MPEMYEIYQKHASEYDELVSAEDYRCNLRSFLMTSVNWNNKYIYEAGIGTGRVTALYIDKAKKVYGVDRESHMLDRCALNLENKAGPTGNKLKLSCAENTALPVPDEKADVFIEGWSFLHTMNDCLSANPASAESSIDGLLSQILNSIEENLKKGSTIIIIESLGTNVSEPIPPNKAAEIFYQLLENKFSFVKTILSTDYKFTSCSEAARITGFFFGKRMADMVLSQGSSIVPEFTGVWMKKN